MNDRECNHDQDHQRSIEDVDDPLVGHEVAILAHRILDESEDASYKDQDAGDVDVDQVLLPREVALLDFLSRVLRDAEVKEGGDDHEEGEEDDLDRQANQDDGFACVLVIVP